MAPEHFDKIQGPNRPTYIDLINNCDLLKLSINEQDILGCVLPHELDLVAGPNARRFILRPIEHANKCHAKVVNAPADDGGEDHGGAGNGGGGGRGGGNQMILSPTSSSSRNLTLKKPTSTQTLISKHVNKTSTVVFKHGKKLKMGKIDLMIDPHLSINAETHDSLDEWAKNYCITTVLTGANKMVSNVASICFYDSVMDGVRQYHETVLKDIVIDGKVVLPPPRVTLNSHNIPVIQKSILDGYKSMDTSSNPYHVLRGNPIYSLSHDGIQKFSRELNGVYIRTVDPNLSVVNVPWSLTEIEGGSLNSAKLEDHILRIISRVHPVPVNATSALYREAERQNIDGWDVIPKPPILFDCCELTSVDFVVKKIEFLLKNWPVAVVGDGCSTNSCAMKNLVDYIGLVTPSARCTSHAADGSMKRMTNSVRYCVEEVKEFVQNFRVILRHFKLSGKSTSLLNNALDLLEMKEVHMMTFCPTRMSYILSSAKQVLELIVPICDVMATADIKPENRSIFMTPKSFTILHILADVETIFVKYFLRTRDRDDALIIEAYHTSLAMVDQLNSAFRSTKLDKFLDLISEDEFGNIQSSHTTVAEDGSEHLHDILLNYNHRPRRGDPATKIEIIKAEAVELKEKVVSNLVTNIADQSQENTVVEFASLFDLDGSI